MSNKSHSKFDCLVHEMLQIKDLTPSLNVQIRHDLGETICVNLRVIILLF